MCWVVLGLLLGVVCTGSRACVRLTARPGRDWDDMQMGDDGRVNGAMAIPCNGRSSGKAQRRRVRTSERGERWHERGTSALYCADSLSGFREGSMHA